MDARRFEALLDAYGAEPQRWPAGEREAAQAFARTEDGGALLRATLELDDWLDAAAPIRPSPELRERVLAAAPQPGRRNSVIAWLERAWGPGAGLAAAGLAGVLFGAALSGPRTDAQAEILLAEAGAYDEAALSVEATP
jgi:hypothetical protein